VKGINVTMTDTTSTVRTYAVDETPDEYTYREETGTWCREPVEGYVCSIARGHRGPQHVAAVGHRILAVADRDTSGDTDEPTTELDRFRELVRATALRQRERGYGDHAAWNTTLVKLGLQPFTRRKARVVAPISRVVAELPNDFTEAEAREWLNARRDRLETYLRPMEGEIGEPVVEVEAVVEGVEGVEAEDGADTEDLDEYKALVLRVALEMQADHGWCDSGTQEVLDDLGLQRTHRHRVRVKVTATRYFYAEVDAKSDTEAWEAVDAMDSGEVWEAIERYDEDQMSTLGGWDHESHDSSTTTYQLD
jgi:hypothetical protein